MAARGKVITANRLTDGVTLYFTAAEGWTETLARAAFLAEEGAAEAMLRAAERDVARLLIVDPYRMDAELGDEGPRPVSARERIRAGGPTVSYVFP